MDSLQIKTRSTTHIAKILEASSVTSKFSGKELSRFKIQFKVLEPLVNEISEALSAGTVSIVSQTGGDDLTVAVFQEVHSFTVNNPLQTYTWVLTQTENLVLDSLQIGDLILRPYKFSEKIDGNALIANLRIRVDSPTEAMLRSLPQYFQVIRRGISDEPVEMRFGQILWSFEEDEYNIRITLVAKSYDDEGHTALFQPELGNIEDLLLASEERLFRLLNLLQSKGTINEEERKTVNEIDEGTIISKTKNLYRVKNLDEWLKSEDGDDD